jgi:hypothetical protein
MRSESEWTLPAYTYHLYLNKLLGAFLHVFATCPTGRAEDAGEYTCTATSQTDHFSRNIRLLIQSKILKKKKTFFVLVSLNELNCQNNFTPEMLPI